MTRRKPQPQPVGRPRLDRDDPADPTERHTLTMRRSEWAYLRRHGRTLSEGARVVIARDSAGMRMVIRYEVAKEGDNGKE